MASKKKVKGSAARIARGLDAVIEYFKALPSDSKLTWTTEKCKIDNIPGAECVVGLLIDNKTKSTLPFVLSKTEPTN